MSLEIPCEFFAETKIIKGKVDDAKHSGKVSEVRRIQAAEHQVKEALKDLPVKKK